MHSKIKEITKKELFEFMSHPDDGLAFIEYDKENIIINHGHNWMKHNSINVKKWLKEINKNLSIPKGWVDEMWDLRRERINNAMWKVSKKLKTVYDWKKVTMGTFEPMLRSRSLLQH